LRAYNKASKSGLNNNGASGAFKSTSDRPDPTHYRTPEERGWKAEALPPGPAFYKPADAGRKSFHLNVCKRFV